MIKPDNPDDGSFASDQNLMTQNRLIFTSDTGSVKVREKKVKESFQVAYLILVNKCG